MLMPRDKVYCILLNEGFKSEISNFKSQIIGGTEQIRTAVKGFADLCLATRPRYHFKRTSIRNGGENSNFMDVNQRHLQLNILTAPCNE